MRGHRSATRGGSGSCTGDGAQAGLSTARVGFSVDSKIIKGVVGRKGVRAMAFSPRTLRTRVCAVVGMLVVLALLPVPRADAAPGGRHALTPAGTYEGFGEGFSVAMARLDGRHDRIVLGGRGIAVLDERSLRTHRPRWSYHWTHAAGRVGGDHTWANAVEPVRGASGRGSDLVVSTSDNELIRFDGGGRIVWRRPDAWQYPFGDALKFVDMGSGKAPAIVGQYGSTAYSSADGRPLWTAPSPAGDGPPAWVNPADLGAGPGQAVVYGTEPNCWPGGGGGETAARARQRDRALGKVPSALPDGDCKGHIFAYSNTGRRLWQVTPAQQILTMATADLTGDGLSETIAGQLDGSVVVYSPDGSVLWRTAVAQKPVMAVTVVRGRVYAAAGPELVALDGSGGRLWSQPTEGPLVKLEGADLRSGRGGQLLAVAVLGQRTHRLVAVDPARSGDRRMWDATVHDKISDVAVGTWHGERVVTVGSADAVVRGLSAGSGRQVFDYLGHGRVTAIGSGRLSGRFGSPIAHTDDKGHVVLSDAGGRDLWRRWLGGDELAYGSDVAFADLGRHGTGVVAAGNGTTWQDGIVRAYDGRGRVLWTGHTSGPARRLVAARLSRRGPRTILALVSRGGDSGVAAFDPGTGRLLWERTIAAGAGILAAGDADGDGLDEIAFSTVPPPFRPGTLALLSPDGEVRWKKEGPDIRRWVAVAPGRLIFGGLLAGGSAGAAGSGDGADLWRTALPGTSEYGVLVPRRDGVAVSTDAGLVGLLDAATGRVAFSTRIVSDAGAGPLTLLPQGRREPRLVVSESSGSFRTRVHALSLDGRILATSKVMQEGGGIAITPVSTFGGGASVAVGAGLSVYTYRYR